MSIERTFIVRMMITHFLFCHSGFWKRVKKTTEKRIHIYHYFIHHARTSLSFTLPRQQYAYILYMTQIFHLVVFILFSASRSLSLVYGYFPSYFLARVRWVDESVQYLTLTLKNESLK
jgi:hypothetical protein